MLRAEVGGLSIAYQRAGDGPPLVLLRGFTHDSRAWRPQHEGLADQFTVIAWDAPGDRAGNLRRTCFGTAQWFRVWSPVSQLLSSHGIELNACPDHVVIDCVSTSSIRVVRVRLAQPNLKSRLDTRFNPWYGCT